MSPNRSPAEPSTSLRSTICRGRYEPLSDDEARTEMAADTPAPFIDAFLRFFTDGEFDDSLVGPSVREITGRPPRTFEEWALAHLPAFTNDAMT